MRDQRRLLGARALRRDPGGARRRPALPALAHLAAPRLLPQLRARAGAGARRSDATSRSPTRTTAGTPTSSRRCWPSWATRSSSTATRGWSTATAACAPTPTGAPAPTTTPTCSRCWWRTRSPAPPRCSRGRCSTTRCRSRPRSSRTSTITGSRSSRSRSATSRSSSARSTTTSSTAARRSATRPPTAWWGCASGSMPCAATRASGSGCGGCTTTSTSAGCCSSRRSCGCACWPRMAADKRRALERFERADGSLLALGGLAWRGAQELLGRRHDTLGAEWMLAHAFVWRRLLTASTRDAPTRLARLDSLPPPAFDPRPGARAPAEPAVRAIAEKIAPLRLAVSDDAPRRVNLLIPSIDLQHFFGGYIGKFNLARRLAARGERVRIVTVDPVGLAAGELAPRRRGLQRAGGDARRGRGRVRARVAGDRDEPRRRADRHHLVDRPPRRRRAARARRRPLPLPDPGVRAVHVPDGQLRGAGRGELHVPAHRGVLDRAAARLLPPPLAGRLRRRRRRRRLDVVRQRDHRHRPAGRGRAGRPLPAAAAVLRAAGAARGAQHVRARRARPEPGARARRVRRAGSCTASARCARAAGSTSAAAR